MRLLGEVPGGTVAQQYYENLWFWKARKQTRNVRDATPVQRHRFGLKTREGSSVARAKNRGSQPVLTGRGLGARRTSLGRCPKVAWNVRAKCDGLPKPHCSAMSPIASSVWASRSLATRRRMST